MRKVFNSQFKITQEFGVNPDYYKKFGLTAHEGLDLIPTGSVWEVSCLEDGVVVRDEDNARSGAYGINVTIWHNKVNKATQYCHLSENYVSSGQIVKAGERIGKMGSTGNSSGAHLHLNLFETDDNGVRLNRNNGYFGGINPLPFLQENREIIAQEIAQPQKADQYKRAYKALTGVWVNQDEIDPWVKRGLSLDDTMIEIMKGDGRFKRLWIDPVLDLLKEDAEKARTDLKAYITEQREKEESAEIVTTIYPRNPAVVSKTPPQKAAPAFSGPFVNVLNWLLKKVGL